VIILINTGGSMDIMSFYRNNLEKLDDKWFKFCFFEKEGRTPSISKKMYHNHRAFWNFVELSFKEYNDDLRKMENFSTNN